MIPNDELFKLVQERCPEQAEFLAEVLAPFYQIAENGVWPLMPQAHLDQDRALVVTVESAIKHAYGLEAYPEIEFCSRSNAFARPGWITDRAWENLNLDEGIVNAVIMSLKRPFSWEQPGSFEGDDELRSCFEEVPWRDLEENLSLRWFAGAYMERLFSFLKLHLEGDHLAAKELETLIRLLPYVIPLGEKDGVPGTWIVLCS